MSDTDLIRFEFDEIIDKLNALHQRVIRLKDLYNSQERITLRAAEVGQDTVKEVNPGDWINHGKRLFWVCECKGIAHLVGEYSEVCELCGASRPQRKDKRG